MKQYLITLTIAVAACVVQADPLQQITLVGDNGTTGNQHLIGDTDASQNEITSTSTQLGNSANNNGATINTDTRDQNTFTPTSNTHSAATGGASIGNQSDNRASVGNTSTGPSSATSGPVTGTNTSENKVSGITGPSTSTSAAQGGAANQKQSQSQQTNTEVANGSSSLSGSKSNSGGNQLEQKTNASADNSGNSRTKTTVDASSQSTYNSKATAWAPVIHGPAAPALAAGNVLMAPSVCGPRVIVIRREVIGVRFGVWGGQTNVVQGYDETIASAEPVFLQQGPYLLGHTVTTYTTALGTSSAGSMSIGGYGKNGDGAQGGGATSGALQQLVQRHTVRDCVMANSQN